MSDSPMSAVKQSLLAIRTLQAELDAMIREKTEPIAVIGAGCRLPGGASSPEALWELLVRRFDAVTEVPPERWALDPPAPGATPEQRAARWGAFLAEVDRFDARFFDISPREAERLDPQQRLLLEVTWEALERAGAAPVRLVGSRTGVFVGIATDDYRLLTLDAGADAQDSHTWTGNGHAFVAGRLSYAFGFEGASVAIDTACSSSLVAVHLACQSLRSGESSLAIAAGVNLMLAPITTHQLASLKALSPDGRCRAFDARANGYVRGEGCAAVVLKRLSAALADGDPILGLIRGSAVNQDGRSTSLTAPNVRSQAALIRRALEDARVPPAAIGYVETHGTGTPLGDPIEVDALAEVLGGPRADGSRCALGAVKTNFGHLEAAAGILGLLKALLVLERGEIPPNLHQAALNPRIDLEGTALLIPRESIPWPGGGGPRFAGVSSFGLSGTNAHIVLEQAPAARRPEPAPVEPLVLLPISAKTPEALLALGRAYVDLLSAEAPPPSSPLDIACTAATGRSHFEHRLAIVGRSARELAAALTARLGEVPAPRAPGPRKLVFVFPGHGSQRAGMGRELFAEEPVFRDAILSCDEAIRREAGWSVVEALTAPEGAAALERVDIVQPALFAVEVALAALWRSWGIEPDAVIGHSMGEVAAAHFAGALGLDDAARIMCRRAALLRRVSGAGAMVMVDLSAERAQAARQGREDQIFVAGRNGPRSTILAGEPSALSELVAELERGGVVCRRVNADVAFHSPFVDPLIGPLEGALPGLRPGALSVPMISTVTGERLRGEELVARYWGQNLRAEVLFSAAAERLIAEGHELFLEISPHPILLPSLADALRARGRAGLLLPSLRRDREERRALLESLGSLYTEGRPTRWSGVHPAGGRRVPLPTYPFQRRRYWMPGARPAVPARGAGEGAVAGEIREMIHEIAWRPAALLDAPQAPPAEPGTWLLLGGGSAARGLRERIEARGGSCLCFQREGAETAREILAQALERARGRLRGVVHLECLDLDPASGAAQAEAACAGLLDLVQALIARGMASPPRLWVLTRGAHAVGRAPRLGAIAQATAGGLARVVATEHPELGLTTIDLDPDLPAGEEDALARILLRGGPLDTLALRADGAYVAALAASPAEPPRTPPGTLFHPDASYLITGGLGSLGTRVAAWMAARGARHLVLVGRRSGASGEGTSAAERAGARCVVELADVCREDELAGVLARIDRAMPRLRGVFHAAGVADICLLRDLDPARLGAVLSPKVQGAWNLHRLTEGRPLDHFILFSSIASWLGLPGQGAYAAANAFLDALAAARRAAGQPGMSVGWCAWTGMGVAAAPVAERAVADLARRGVAGLRADQGLAILEHLIRRGPEAPARTIVLPIDERSLGAEAARAGSARWLALLGRAGEPDAGADHARAPAPDLRRALAAAPTPARRRATLERHVRAQIERVLRVPADEVGLDTPMRALGMDSFMGVELRDLLEASLGLPLPATLVWQRPTLRELAAHLDEALTTDGDDRGPPATPAPDDPASEAEVLAALLDEVEDLSDGEVRRLLDHDPPPDARS